MFSCTSVQKIKPSAIPVKLASLHSPVVNDIKNLKSRDALAAFLFFENELRFSSCAATPKDDDWRL